MRKGERVGILALLTLVLGGIFMLPPLQPASAPAVTALLFSSLILLSLSALLLEHFFSKPSDVVAASVSILLVLVPSRDLLGPLGIWYWILVAASGGVLVAALSSLLLVTDEESENSRRNRAARILKALAVDLGSGKKQYFFLFFLLAMFFVPPTSPGFVVLMGYAAVVVAIDPQKVMLNFRREGSSRPEEVGQILGVRGKNTFLVRLHDRNKRPTVRSSDLLEFSYGIDEPPCVRVGAILERYYLDQAQWVNVLCIDTPPLESPEPSNRRNDAVYRRDGSVAAMILNSLVGVIYEGSSIQTVRFLHAGRARVEEGSLLEVESRGCRVFYQVVNAKVDFEALESKNRTDLVLGEAVQLGTWNPETQRFERFGWVPDAYSPLHTCGTIEDQVIGQREMVLGEIPGSTHKVALNLSDAISHHTAILGVTGSGKSVFARHLVQNVVEDPDVRVVIVDFTREWAGKLPRDSVRKVIADELESELRAAVSAFAAEKAKYPDRRDQVAMRGASATLRDGFERAIREFLVSDERIGIFELPDVSNAEGVLEYTQTFFWALFNMAKREDLGARRICIVLEEAHTVIPEWNFIGLADKSSQALVNNLSQIALQGRKYGIGFIIIAQRTANVSKTVLTQCNTVIAFQCFDETSLNFLGNYLPREMCGAIPGLRARHAVAVGKAVVGSVPLMFQVPDLSEAVTVVPPTGTAANIPVSAAPPAAAGPSGTVTRSLLG